ncbi:MAG: NAD(P)H-hydrate dehydratase [gamma proteobacterium symbiont of Taylorina sp.]|nr:NAD(P)H-hydrate dehydratase [gamma proteobacterium symbiont of Taylorina sp.]
MNYKPFSYRGITATGHHSKPERYNYMHFCYSRETVRSLDYLMVEQGIVDNSYELMNRAAQALLDFIFLNYPGITHITIICGAGNNAGDGYVLARLVKLHKNEPHIKVNLISVFDVEHLSGDAHQAYIDWIECGGSINTIVDTHFSATDLVIDALIGTGLNRNLEDEWYDAVAQINLSNKPVISVDIPSGLDANTGSTYGIAVHATHTITFIGQKTGMYTAESRRYCGAIHFASLGVPEELYRSMDPDARLMEWAEISRALPHRSPVSHKWDHGHLLIIGGDYGMAGACRIAGEAALRSGAGLVSIATHIENVNAITSARPELMVHGVESGDDLEQLLNHATAIAIGPGLGTGQWGISLLDKVLKFLKKQPDYNQSGKTGKVHCVIDADALNIMAKHNMVMQNKEIIYTPHFGEACRLLKIKPHCPSESTDRFAMIKKLKEKYYGLFILKGAGTLVDINDEISICPYGNEGMASSGMGDCLTGMIGSLLAQKLSVYNAVHVAVCLHAKAGDHAAKEGKNGMIVSDLFPKIRELLN